MKNAERLYYATEQEAQDADTYLQYIIEPEDNISIIRHETVLIVIASETDIEQVKQVLAKVDL